MSNCTDPDAYVVLSKIRTGLKREFAFAFKSQSESASLTGRTRSTRSENRINMRFKSSDSDERENGLENPTAERESICVDLPLDIVEAKKSKNIGIKKIPMKLKELLKTGLLEGLSVKYIRGPKGRGQLDMAVKGVIKGSGILCSCDICNGSETISPNQFELHAGSANKRPSDYIYLENGSTLRDVLNACKDATQDNLAERIEKAICFSAPERPISCLNCNGLIGEGSNDKTTQLCHLCTHSKQTHHSSPQASRNGDRSSIAASIPKSSDRVSCSLSHSKAQGKLTRKHLGMHKLIFEDGVLDDGEELGYYVRGKKLMSGYYKKGHGIVCSCCDSKVSPSQFEAHAGYASRRKPYLQIFTSKGVSLHELSIQIARAREFSVAQNDDLCSICADGGNLLACNACPRSFHTDCISLPSTPTGKWYCKYCTEIFDKEKLLQRNANAIAAGRVPGITPMEETKKRCIRRVETSKESECSGCVLCRAVDFSRKGFGPRTVMLCDQCEKEYHVGCLKQHKMDNLKELPKGKWFCCTDCKKIHSVLQKLVFGGEKKLPEPLLNAFTQKNGQKDSEGTVNSDVRWRILSGNMTSDQTRVLFSKAAAIFHDQFNPIVYSNKASHDLIPDMLFGRSYMDHYFEGMYCAILTVNLSVVSAAIFRIFGPELAELPLVATSSDCQGKGYFRLLFSCIENLLASLNVKTLVLPAADEAELMWTEKFGFEKMPCDQLKRYQRDNHLMVFGGTSMLQKPVSRCCV